MFLLDTNICIFIIKGKNSKVLDNLKKNRKKGLYVFGPFDMLIGAHAKSLKMTLVTNNTNEFKRIKDLTIEDWTM